MKAAITQFRDRMACLADPSRFAIVLVLAGGEQCVSAIAREVGLSQSCTTRHLQALQRLGLVLGQRRGREVMFAVCGEEPEIRLVLEATRHAETVAPDGAALLARRVARKPASVALPAGSSRERAASKTGLPRVVSRADDRPLPPAAPEFDREAASDNGEEIRPSAFPRPRVGDLEDFLL